MSNTEGENSGTTQTAQANVPTPTVTEIATIALKLPTFWPADPQVWFPQVESQFVTGKVTNQDTKFHHIFASLPLEFAVDIRDLIIHKLVHNAYDELKDKLITRMPASRTKRLQQLL